MSSVVASGDARLSVGSCKRTMGISTFDATFAELFKETFFATMTFKFRRDFVETDGRGGALRFLSLLADSSAMDIFVFVESVTRKFHR